MSSGLPGRHRSTGELEVFDFYFNGFTRNSKSFWENLSVVEVKGGLVRVTDETKSHCSDIQNRTCTWSPT